MLEIIITSLVSILVSLGIDKCFTLDFYRLVANAGYRGNVSKIEDLSYNACPISQIDTVIPIFNILIRITEYTKIRTSKLKTIEKLKRKKLIIPMNEKEKDIYKKNKTGYQAMQIMLEAKLEEAKIQSIFLIINGKENEIFYRIKDNELEIIKIEGPVKSKTKEEIKGLIFGSWNLLFRTGIKLHGEKFFKYIKKHNEYSIKGEATSPTSNNVIQEMRFKYTYDELCKLTNLEDDEEHVKVKKLEK